MIHAHVLDAWTARDERSAAAFGYLNIIAGFAAPLFLWLAGLSVAMSAERGLSLGKNRTEASARLLRRGAEIFALAFVFRAQSFVVSPGNPLVSLLRVDILNIMGPAMVVAAWLWRVSPGTRVAAFALGATGAAIAFVTPLVRAATWVSALPPLMQWYITPSGNHSTFTLFPWTGFVFAGAAHGTLLTAVALRDEGKALWRLAVAGIGLSALSYATAFRPSIYTASSFWTSSPTYFGMRVGAMMVLLSVLFVLSPLASAVPRGCAALARLGRHSLFVYWVHVELVYGYITAPLHHRLPLWGGAVAWAVLAAAMYWSLNLRDHGVAWWRSRDARTRSRTVAG